MTKHADLKDKLESEGFKLACPQCNGNISHRRVDDGESFTEFKSDGSVEREHEKSHGYDEIVCTQCDGEIPVEMQNIILDHMES